jgi:hypothetical protein
MPGFRQNSAWCALREIKRCSGSTEGEIVCSAIETTATTYSVICSISKLLLVTVLRAGVAYTITARSMLARVQGFSWGVSSSDA